MGVLHVPCRAFAQIVELRPGPQKVVQVRGPLPARLLELQLQIRLGQGLVGLLRGHIHCLFHRRVDRRRLAVAVTTLTVLSIRHC